MSCSRHTVVRREGYDGVIAHSQLLQHSPQPAHLMVQRADASVVVARQRIVVCIPAHRECKQAGKYQSRLLT